MVEMVDTLLTVHPWFVVIQSAAALSIKNSRGVSYTQNRESFMYSL